MKVKSLVVSVAGGLALLGAQASFACSLAAWGQGNPPGGTGTVGAPTAGEPTATKRYSQRCGLTASASGNYVQDGLPTNEARVTGRVYFYSGAQNGSGSIYQLESGGGSPATLLNLTYDADNDQLDIATTGATGSINGVVQDRWWVFTFDWNTATTNVVVTARGSGSATSLTSATVGGVGAAERAETSKVGHISGAFTGTGNGRFWDAVEFRRTTVPAQLCRGNANTDNLRNSGDQIAIRNEFLGLGLAPNNPDCNEDGFVNSGDQICVRNIFLAGTGDCTTGTP